MDLLRWFRDYSVQVSAAVTVVILGAGWGFYQQWLKGAQEGYAHLTKAQAAIVSIPVPAVVAVFAAVLLLGVYVTARLQKGRVVNDVPGVHGAPFVPMRSVAITEAQEAIVQELAPVALLFRRTKELEVKTVVFLNDMESDLPGPHKGIALNDASAEFLRFLHRNRERYDDELEPELIKLAMELRARGIMPTGLTDAAILNESILPQTVEPIRRGLSEAGNELSGLLARKASEL